MTRDIPENVETQQGDDEGIHGPPSPEGSAVTSVNSRAGSNVTHENTNEGVGVVTRSRKRFLANSAHGKFPGGADLITGRESGSLVSPHSHWGDTGDMGSSSCVSAPLLCLGVWDVLLLLQCLQIVSRRDLSFHRPILTFSMWIFLKKISWLQQNR